MALGIGKRGKLENLLFLGYVVDHKRAKGDNFDGLPVGYFPIFVCRNNLIPGNNDILSTVLLYQFIPVVLVKFPLGFEYKSLFVLRIYQESITEKGKNKGELTIFLLYWYWRK